LTKAKAKVLLTVLYLSVLEGERKLKGFDLVAGERVFAIINDDPFKIV
jgi:hypothetical protein